MQGRRLSRLDKVLSGASNFLKTIASPAAMPARAYPAARVEDGELSDTDRRHAAGLMRVNHAGEIAAQGLYQGHAAVARSPGVEAQMQRAADEEFDHLAWCEKRLAELGAGRSRLSPIWYAGSFAIGAASGVLGDKWSLGFIAETESQVVEHLDGHFENLPENDRRSRAIVQKMRDEEREHGQNAVAAGAAELPRPVRSLMRMTSKILTRAAYRI